MSAPEPSPLRRAVLVAVLLASGLPAACAPSPETAPVPGPPARNLLFISIDTLRADHVGGYGYDRPTTPFLDRLAAEGTLFVDAISPASWTVPAHTTMMTGLNPSAHGILAYPKPGRLSDDATTLAEVLRDAGFRTAAFTGGGYMSRKHGLKQGFEVYDGRGLRFPSKRDPLREWLDSVQVDERFFVFLHGFDVHGPYQPPAPFDRAFVGDFEGDFDTEEFSPDRERVSDEVLEYVVSQYDGEIRAVDALLERLFEDLGASGHLEDTLVVVTSDHGEEMYEHGSIEHTHSLYEELVRVPLIFHGPGVPAARVEQPVGLVDLYPTILERLDIVSPHPVQGRALFADFPPAPRPQFSFVEFRDFPYRLAAVRTDRWKLIRWRLAGMAEVDWSEVEAARYTHRFRERHEDFVELFDLAADPGERRNVAAEHPEVVAQLSELLAKHRAQAADLRLASQKALAPDPEYLEALEALGYVEGDE